MSRRIALALSFSLTVVMTFALASFASQAGWLEAKSDANEEAAVAEEVLEPAPPPESNVQQEPVVITEYVYMDVPASTPPAQVATAAPPAPTPQPASIVQPTEIVSNGTTAVSAPRQAPQPAQPSPTTRRTASSQDDSHGDDEQSMKKNKSRKMTTRLRFLHVGPVS